MSAESLVLLCPKTNCFDPRGRGGVGALRPEDIAGACAGLARNVFVFGLFMVVNDRSVQRELVYYAHLEVVDLAIARGWRAPAGSMVWRKMAILALCETVGVDCSRRCKRQGDISEQEAAPVECPECGGSGLRRFTAAEREEALGVRGRRWLFRYEIAYRRISGWQTTLDDHLRRGLRTEPTDVDLFAVPA
jgi:hypothetical protein